MAAEVLAVGGGLDGRFYLIISPRGGYGFLLLLLLEVLPRAVECREMMKMGSMHFASSSSFPPENGQKENDNEQGRETAGWCLEAGRARSPYDKEKAEDHILRPRRRGGREGGSHVSGRGGGKRKIGTKMESLFFMRCFTFVCCSFLVALCPNDLPRSIDRWRGHLCLTLLRRMEDSSSLLVFPAIAMEEGGRDTGGCSPKRAWLEGKALRPAASLPPPSFSSLHSKPALYYTFRQSLFLGEAVSFASAFNPSLFPTSLFIILPTKPSCHVPVR